MFLLARPRERLSDPPLGLEAATDGNRSQTLPSGRHDPVPTRVEYPSDRTKDAGDPMAELQDIPRLVSEFTTMAKEYLRQETIEPAKRLGYFAGMSLLAASLWAIALILISVAALRALVDVLPSGEYWEALAYAIYAIFLVVFCVLIVKIVPERGVHDTPSHTDPESA